MATLRVPATYATVAEAAAAAQPGDVIDVDASYSGGETVEVATNDLTFRAPETVTGLVLIAQAGVSTITADGTSPIEIRCATGDAITVNGGAGDNLIDVGDSRGNIFAGDGDDVVLATLENIAVPYGETSIDGGAGHDALIIDFSEAIGAVFSNPNGFFANNQLMYFENIEVISITGGKSSDFIDAGEAASASISGGGGNDRFLWRGQDGIVLGGEGQDTLVAEHLGGVETEGVETLTAFSSGHITGSAAQFSLFSLITGPSPTSRGDHVELRLVGEGGELDLSGRLLGDVVVSAAAATGAVDLTASAGDDQLAGSAFSDTLDGGGGDDVLSGLGGGDFLTGSAGRDVFFLGKAPETWRDVDTIVDFAPADDVIKLDRDGFPALSFGALSEGAFKDIGVAGAAVDGDDRIIYNSANGALYYDADGSGSADRVKLALLWNGAIIDHGDIVVV